MAFRYDRTEYVNLRAFRFGSSFFRQASFLQNRYTRRDVTYLPCSIRTKHSFRLTVLDFSIDYNHISGLVFSLNVYQSDLLQC